MMFIDYSSSWTGQRIIISYKKERIYDLYSIGRVGLTML